MTSQQYRQCHLRHGKTRTTSWLPIEFSRPGSWVRIGGQDWEVISAYKTSVSMEFLGNVRDAQKDRASTVG